jgi:hypothetical protein
MKKMAMGILVVLATLSFITSPAMAANNPQEVSALSAFLGSLASPGAPAPTPAAQRPGLVGKDGCSTNVDCGSGNLPVSCTGTTASSCTGVARNCSAGQQGYVICDEAQTLCPPCPCSLNCAAERNNCDIDCGTCPFIFSCSTSTCTFSCQCRVTGSCLL